MTNVDNNNLVIDGAVAVGAMTLPWWAQILGEWVGLAISVLWLGLLVIRIGLAIREWKRG
jgi:hypothetical protein